MNVDCKHWRHVGASGHGQCAKGLFGGAPSAGVCGGCKAREPTGLTINGKCTLTLLTGCEENFELVHAPTVPGKIEYCRRHNIRFVNRPYKVAPWGDRQRLCLEELPRADWLWFIDADTLIMNHAIDVRSVIDNDYDCIIGVDVNGINNGSVLLRNCPATVKFLNDVLFRRGLDPNDQVAMGKVFDATPGYRVKRIGQRAFNSYLEKEYRRPDDDRFAYREGDLLLHFPGMANARRMELIREYLPKVNSAIKDNPWTAIHEAARDYCGDSLAAMATLYGASAKLPATCGCHERYAAHLANHPPDLRTRRTFQNWTHDLHNRVNAHLGKPAMPIEEARALWSWNRSFFLRPPEQHIVQSAAGIGDSIVGAYVAAGLADVLGKPVIYHCKYAHWLSRIRHPNLIIERLDNPKAGPDLTIPNAERGKTHGSRSRAQIYADSLAQQMGIATFRPVRPLQVDQKVIDIPAGDFAVISPFISMQRYGREWPEQSWREVIAALIEHDIQPIVLDDGTKDGVKIYGGCGTLLHIGRHTDAVIDLLIGARVVLSNDSGIAHAGGLFGAPTVCVHAGTVAHEFLFDCAPTVRSVTNGRVGGSQWNDSNLAELVKIPPARVIAAIDEMIGVKL